MVDFEEIKRIYKLGATITFEDVLPLIREAQLKTFQIGEYIIREGSQRQELFFIRKGLVRSLKMKDNGDEVTVGLFWENKFFLSPEATFLHQPAKSYFEAVECTEVFIMSYDRLIDFISKKPKLENAKNLVFAHILLYTLDQLNAFKLLSSEERYLSFMQSHAAIIHRVPDKYIANVLGITPVSLSRVKKRIFSKRK